MERRYVKRQREEEVCGEEVCEEVEGRGGLGRSRVGRGGLWRGRVGRGGLGRGRGKSRSGDSQSWGRRSVESSSCALSL